MKRESVSTRHIGGHIYFFYPHTITFKREAQDIASQLRKKGYKARVLHVHSDWNKRWQYEIFTHPASHPHAELVKKFGGGR